MGVDIVSRGGAEGIEDVFEIESMGIGGAEGIGVSDKVEVFGIEGAAEVGSCGGGGGGDIGDEIDANSFLIEGV